VAEVFKAVHGTAKYMEFAAEHEVLPRPGRRRAMAMIAGEQKA
jgi:hypothetical protein